jgi:hypothetical protein
MSGERDDRAPSDPPADPKQQPAPPANPDVDEEAVERGRDRLDEVSGH